MAKLEVPIGNIITSDHGETTIRYCKDCKDRMIVLRTDFVCKICGERIPLEDVKPKARLVSVEQESIVLNGEGSIKNEVEDIPKGATLIEEVTLG